MQTKSFLKHNELASVRQTEVLWRNDGFSRLLDGLIGVFITMYANIKSLSENIQRL